MRPIDAVPAESSIGHRAALAVWEACRHSAMLLFGAMTGDRDADRIYGVLTQHGGSMTRTELNKMLAGHTRAGDIEHSLVVLASRRLIRRQSRKTGGRPEERLLVVDLVRDPCGISGVSEESPEPDRLSPLISLSPQRSLIDYRRTT